VDGAFAVAIYFVISVGVDDGPHCVPVTASVPSHHWCFVLVFALMLVYQTILLRTGVSIAVSVYDLFPARVFLIVAWPRRCFRHCC
jgi:hypothetical protein